MAMNMDYFSVFLEVFCLAAQSVLHIGFTGRLTGRKKKFWYFAAYFFLLFVIERLAGRNTFFETAALGLEIAVLYGMNRFAMGNRSFISWIAAILAVYISQLSFGMINGAEAIIFPNLIGRPLLYVCLLLATAAALILCACCYILILKLLSLRGDKQLPYIGLLLFPGIFFFAAELYILSTSYGRIQQFLSLAEYGKHIALFFLQALGLGALFCTLYAYRRICHGFQIQAERASLAQTVQAQKVYIEEAQLRYEKTKAFRHDIKNHLSVLEGLLRNGKLEEGRAYLQKLEAASASDSFPYQTGSPIVDILLSEKLELAKANGVAAEVSLFLPKPCGIDDVDLCVIFSNALDNALHACRGVEGEKRILIAGKRQGDFYLVRFENTCLKGPMMPLGIGLSNIKAAAEKYHGAMLAEKTEDCFILNVLLNISSQAKDISAPKS